MTTYTPHAALHGGGCVHCGMRRGDHHADGRCVALAELEARLRAYQQTGRWPEPDEGCTLEEDEA